MILSYIAGFLAMSLIIVSYFVKEKKYYLLYQLLGIAFLTLSYVFGGQYFASISMAICIVRATTFYLYEQKEKKAPIGLSFLFALATVVAYFFMHDRIEYSDILCLTAAVLYAFIFRISDLKTVRFLMLIPTALSIWFNIWIHAPVFVCISYVFELCADLLSILKYHVNAEELYGNAKRKN